MVKQEVTVNATGPLGFLWVALIVLRLMEVITWHWGVVIFWPVAVVAGILAFAFGIMCLGFCYDEYKRGVGKSHVRNSN